MFQYSINIAWSDEDNCYLGSIPEFPTLMAHGDTPEETVYNTRLAAEGFIEVMQEDGDPIPEPLKVKSYSGNLRIRLPKSLHEKLSKEANMEGISLNSYITHSLSSTFSAKELSKVVVSELRRTIEEVQFVASQQQFKEAEYTEQPSLGETGFLWTDDQGNHIIIK